MREHEEERERALALLRGDGLEPVRRWLVRRIVGTETSEGRGLGICGAAGCQACGGLDTYEGFFSAVPLNVWTGVGFIDRRCLSELSGVNGGSYSGEDIRRAGRAVRAQHAGRCDVCGAISENEEESRLCSPCRVALEEQEGPLPQSWWRLKQRRYLELARPDLDDLADLARVPELERRGW